MLLMQRWLPTIAIFICHTLTGTASVTTRYLVSVLDPIEIAFMRYFFGGLAILPLFFLYRIGYLNRVLFLNSVILGILFFALFPYLFSLSYVHTSAARGALVIATMPIWTMIISHMVGHERMNLLCITSIGLTLTGLLIALSDKLFLATGPVNFKGEFIMLIAALAGAIYAINARQLLKLIPATTMTPIAMLAGCSFLLPLSTINGIAEHVLLLTPVQMGLMLYLGVVAGGIAFFLFNCNF